MEKNLGVWKKSELFEFRITDTAFKKRYECASRNEIVSRLLLGFVDKNCMGVLKRDKTIRNGTLGKLQMSSSNKYHFAQMNHLL